MAAEPNRPLITKELLRELGDWRAEKEGRALAAAGAVLTWEYQSPFLQGTVRSSGGTIVNARIKLGQSAVEVENLCVCRQARVEGTICAHVLALVFATMQSPAQVGSDRLANCKAESARPAIAPFPRMIDALPNSQSLELMILLPLDLPTAWRRGELRIILEGRVAGGPFQPFDVIPKPPAAPYAVSEADDQLLTVIERINTGRSPGLWLLPALEFDAFFDALTNHPQVWLGKKTQIQIRGAAARPQLRLDLEPTGELRLSLPVPGRATLRRGLSDGTDATARVPPVELDSWSFDGSTLTRSTRLPSAYQTLLASGAQRLSRTEFVRFYQRELPALEQHLTLQFGSGFDQLQFVEKPAPVHVLLDGGLTGLNLELRAPDPTEWMPDPALPFRYWRYQAVNRAEITAAGFELQGTGYRLTSENRVGHFLANTLPVWERQWKVEYGAQFAHFLRKCDPIQPEVAITSSGENWLALDLAYKNAAGALTLSPADVQRMLQKGAAHHRQSNGRIALVPSSAIEQFQGVIYDCQATQSKDGLQVDRKFAPYLAEALRDSPLRANWQQPTEIRELRPVALPARFEELLRPYQRAGVQWLHQLAANNLAGILADEMGLGKTLQTLVWLATMAPAQAPVPGPGSRVPGPDGTDRKKDSGLRTQDSGLAGRPSLVVCPTSLLANWQAEAERFTPELKTLVLHGADRQELFAAIPAQDLIITSYALLRRDVALHQKIHWQAVVLDEAQHIKNRFSQNAQAVKALSAQNRLVLTGTPLENSLGDLWSIFDFLMPGYLGPATEFRDRYEIPITKQQDPAALQRLRQRLRPFMLRRLKSEVARDLPAKIEQITWCDLTAEQQSVYQSILTQGRREVFALAGAGATAQRRMAVLTTLLRLRQACCHLGLLPSEHDWREPSAKLATCLELIDEAISGDHRVLVFSQFVKLLKLVATALQKSPTDFCYLDGSTVERASEIRRFQESRIPVFLISLKAGGTGLNLTGADTVIHLDPWWNPAVEEQATARAHRIGQQQVVTSYKLIARGSVEEKIVRLQDQKRELIGQLITSDEGFVQGLTAEELQGLLR